MSASKRASAAGVCSTVGGPSRSNPRPVIARSMSRIWACTASAKFRSQAPVTAAAVASRASVSRSSPVSRRSARSAAATSVSVATAGSRNPWRVRRHDSANAVGQESSRFPRISTAKVPARRRDCVPPATWRRTAARKASNAVASAASRGSASSGTACGGSRRPKRGAALPFVDLAFQAPDHHVLNPAAHGVSHLAGPREAHRIEHLEEAGE